MNSIYNIIRAFFILPIMVGVPNGVSMFGDEEEDEEEEEKSGICANCGKYDCEC